MNATADSLKTPLEMLYHWEKVQPDAVYLRQPIGGKWHEYTWRQAANETRRMASAIRGWNLPPGSHIALASKNCAHWMMADMAIWMAGHVSVPLYPNLTTDTVSLIVEHSEAKALFLGKLDDYKPYIDGMGKKIPVIRFPYGGPAEYPVWDDVVKKHEPIGGSPTRRNDEIATIIYTSGTTGEPKGVVHKFLSFSYSATHVLKEIPTIGPTDRFISYLPLAHVAERLLTATVGLYCGGCTSFAESVDLFGKNLAEIKPTVFLGVPRIWEKFRSGILMKVPQQKLDKLLRIPILSSVIRKKIKTGLGLQNAKICISGAAPIPTSLMHWFAKLGIQIQEGYALTENLAYSHLTRRERIRIGCVGQPWPGVDVKIGDQEEILVKCPALMEGYYKNPTLTAEVIRNGYLHTGDQGSVDPEGFLKITGRVKELFKTSKGKYVAPTPIEMKLAANSSIDQICVVGSGMPAPLALVTLSDTGKKLDRAALAASLREDLQRVNGTLDAHERIARIVVLPDHWTVENSFLTPSLKLRRGAVEKKYGPKIEAWSAAKEDVLIG